jgi:phosphocarrier protein HPr
MEYSVTVTNSEGLHARPAGIFVKRASEFKAQVQVKVRGQVKNGKSIMSLMSLGIKNGETISIEAIGDDAEAALSSLVTLVEKQFQL